MKRTILIRSQRFIVVISALTLLAAVLIIVQVGFTKSEQMLLEKASGLLASGVQRNEDNLQDMLDTVRKLSAASSTNRTIAELLLRAAGGEDGHGREPRRVDSYSSEDLERIRQVEALLTNYRNTFFDYQVHSVILGSDGSIYSVLDGVDNSSLFGSNFMNSIAEQDWYQDFLMSAEVSTWVAPCHYNKYGTFYVQDTTEIPPPPADSYLLFVRKIRDYTTQKELGVSVVSVPTRTLERLFAPDALSGMGLFNADAQLIYASDQWEKPLSKFAEGWWPRTGNRKGDLRIQLEEEYLVHYSQVPITGWRLVNITPYDAVVSEIMELRRYIYLFSLVIAGGAMVACSAMLLYITMPLGRLFQRIGEMQIGHRQVGDRENLRITSVVQAEEQINRLLDRVQELSREALDLQELEQNLQYETLRAQLNPHFLFNTLNTIKWSATVSGAGNIAEMISSLGCLLENSMRRGEEMIALRSELDMIRAYMQIKNWALKYRYRLDVDVPEEMLDYPVFKFCLQPLVENAIIHGIDGLEDGRVAIRATVQSRDVVLEVSDNGRGMSPQRADEVLQEERSSSGRSFHHISGVGLSSVHGMIRLRYGEAYGLSIRSAPGEGTTVFMRLPLSEQEQPDIEGGLG